MDVSLLYPISKINKHVLTKMHFDSMGTLRESHLCFLSGYLMTVVRSFENRLGTVATGSKKRILSH